MTAGQWFWIIYVICCVFGGYLAYPYGGRALGVSVVGMVLFGLLGWGVFGAPLK